MAYRGWLRSRRRALVVVALVVLVILASAAHLAFWYGPRERPGKLDPESWEWLSSEGHQHRVYLPFPHQNLTAWSKQLGLELDGSESPGPFGDLSGFGWFAYPPASEVLLAWGGGVKQVESWAVRAQMYRGPTLLMKIAGRLAGNAWLSGGRVPGSPPVIVGWNGRAWNAHVESEAEGLGVVGELGAPGPSWARAPAARVPSTPILLAWAGTSPLPIVAGGPLAVRRVGDEFWLDALGEENVTGGLVRHGKPGDREPSSGMLATRAFLETTEVCVVALETSGRSGSAQALAVLGPLPDHREAAREGTVRVPSALVLSTPGLRKRWPLPAESLSKSLGMVSIEESIDEWALKATDARAARLAPDLIALLNGLRGELPAREAATLWLEPNTVNVLVRDILQVVASSPLLRVSEREQWLGVRSWVEPLARLRLAGIWLDSGRGQVVLEP